MDTADIRNAEFAALVKDAVAVARKDPVFEADLDRFVVGPQGARGGIAWSLARRVTPQNRPVPWSADELLAELLRRREQRNRG